MRTLASLLALAALATPAAAESRGTRIAMAVALLDVTQEHCIGMLEVDGQVKERLFRNFHEYDIAGLASLLSKPLNSFYEDFSYQAKQDRKAFCRGAPKQAARTGYPVLQAGGG